MIWYDDSFSLFLLYAISSLDSFLFYFWPLPFIGVCRRWTFLFLDTYQRKVPILFYKNNNSLFLLQWIIINFELSQLIILMKKLFLFQKKKKRKLTIINTETLRCQPKWLLSLRSSSFPEKWSKSSLTLNSLMCRLDFEASEKEPFFYQVSSMFMSILLIFYFFIFLKDSD